MAGAPQSPPLVADAAFDFADYLGIQRLMHTFNVAFDAGDVETFAGLFTADGSLVSRSGSCTTDAARRQKVVESASRPGHRHFTTNALIEPDEGDACRARATAAYIYVEVIEGRIETKSFGTYEDELVKENGRWLFARREARAEHLRS